jgi:AcrR family transcriptional regulator
VLLPPMPPATPSTKESILNAAERLFAERGYDATSLRAVTKQAGANLAAVNYHFGSKLGLFQAVFERRVGAINRERLELLDRLEADPTGERLRAVDVLHAFLAPPINRLHDSDEGQRLFLRIVGRMQSATGDHTQVIQEVFREVQSRFFPAFRKALPQLSEADLLWRVHLIIGGMCMLLADPVRLKQLSGGLCDTGNAEETLAQLVAFGVAGLEAPPTHTSQTPTDRTGASG